MTKIKLDTIKSMYIDYNSAKYIKLYQLTVDTCPTLKVKT